MATSLLKQMNGSPPASERSCPFCLGRMQLLHHQQPALELDACRPCVLVWFDPLEFEAIPEQGVASTNELQMRAAEAIALHKIQQMKEADSGEVPEETWKWLPGLFGMPVEMEGGSLSRRPWFTWGLSLVIAAVSLLAFTNLEAAVSNWGLVPAEWWRHGGLTFASSFLLHAGWFHLVSNLYFLLVFGDNVEDYLGRWRMAMLIVGASLAGDLLHILSDPRASIPCVGASGGISGVIVFYALQFPRARLGILFRYFVYLRWIRFPAWVALILWIGLQIIGAFEQVRGLSNVSALAHLGGAGVGFIVWLIWHRTEKRSARAEG